MRYYLLPRAEQVRDPLHVWLRPSGYLGQGAGVLALLIFLFLWLYPLRKKFRWLGFTGSISKWLNVHALAALGLPLLVAAHATWQFGGVIGLGFWSMMVVWLSGIVGRYIYARIPRSQAGVELTIEEIAAQRQQLLDDIAGLSGLDVKEVEAVLAPDAAPTAGLGLWQTMRRMVSDDLGRRRAAATLRRQIKLRRPMARREDAAVAQGSDSPRQPGNGAGAAGPHARRDAERTPVLARCPPPAGDHGVRGGHHPRRGGRVVGRHVVPVGERRPMMRSADSFAPDSWHSAGAC